MSRHEPAPPILHPDHPHPLQLISTQASGSTYACTQCNFNVELPHHPAAHPSTLQWPPNPRGVFPGFGVAQVQTPYHVQYYNSFPGAVHQIQSGTSTPQGVNNVAPAQSVRVNPNSQVGRPRVSYGYTMTTAAVHGLVAGATPPVGQYFTHSLIHHGSGGGGGAGGYGGDDAGGYDGGDDGGDAGGYDGGDAGGDDDGDAGGYDGGGFFDDYN